MNPSSPTPSLEQLLLECSLELLREPDQATFFERLVEQAARLLGTPDAYLYLTKGEQLVSQVALGVHAPLRGHRLNRGQGVGGVVWERGQGVRVDDYDSWELRSPNFPYGLLHAIVGVPIRLEGQTVGMLGVSSPDPQRRFVQAEEAVLERFVQVAELALKHYRLAAELKAQRDEATRLLASLSEAVVQTDGSCVVTYLNSAWEQLTGMRPADCVGRPYVEFIHPDDRERLMEEIDRRADRPVSSYEYRLLHATEGYRWVNSRAQLELGADGWVLRVNRVLTDITQHRQDEQALRQGEERKQQLLESLGEAVVEADRQGLITYVNPAWQDMTGFSAAETVGRHYFEFVHAEDQPAVVRLIRQAREEGSAERRLEYRLVVKGGGLRWVNSQGNWLRGADGQIHGMTGVLTDIHARREAEAALLESRERFRRLLDTTPGVVWEAEVGGGNIFISSQAETILGYTPEEWLDDPDFWQQRLHPADFETTLALNAQADHAPHGFSYELEYRFMTKWGQYVWIRDLCRVVVEPGKPRRLLGLMVDITHQKQTELELAVSEERYALAARGSNDGIWNWDLQTNRVHVSARLSAILGLPAQEATHDSAWGLFESVVHPEDLERATAAAQNHLAGETPGASVDLRMRHAEGRWIWVNLRGVAHFSPGGVANRMAGSLSALAERGSYYDPLTHLPGRSLFNDRLERAIAMQSRDPARQFAVLFLDLDRFKVINDSLGHHAGDLLLTEVARRLESCLRPGDTVARLGGDEFVVLLEGLHNPEEALRVAERIREALAQPFRLGANETFSGVSIGVVDSANSFGSVEDYLRSADTAMYKAKGERLGVSRYSPQMHAQASLRLETEVSLRRALAQGELTLHYQPIIELNSGRVRGFEALVRWHHPTRGLVYPLEFIPVAEETGLIVPLGQWVLGRVCRQLTAIQERHPGLYVSVNVAARQLQQAGFAEEVEALLAAHSLGVGWLQLEITENSVVEGSATVLENIERLRRRGVYIHLDDFGTGYSSLSYLRKLPIDALKIDRSFIAQQHHRSNRQIVEAVVQMAKALGLAVVCEGIELQTQADWLRRLEVEYGQGYLYARPMPAERLERFLAEASRIEQANAVRAKAEG
ncbi:MAG: EAL domain-containing protein [Meiothermus sp.]|nr:EAL domain-containing protein [Meiothermus sp.]